MDNAIKFTPQDGRIDVILKKSGKMGIVLISDTGPGIAPEESSRIFNKFYRVNSENQEDKTGYGLGLSIAYSIIELHHGKIVVHSEKGKGSTFRVEFPLV